MPRDTHARGHGPTHVALRSLFTFLSLSAISPSLQTAQPTHPTAFKCLGSSPDRRSCIFSNMYYHLPTDTFYLVGLDSAVHAAVQREADLKPNFNISVRDDIPPDQPNTLTREELVVFWDFQYGAGYSFGHALVHNLLPFYTVLDYHLREKIPGKFTVMNHNGSPSKVFTHMCEASKGRNVVWKQYKDSALKSQAEWVRFKWVILGDAGFGGYAYSLGWAHRPNPNFFNDLTWLRFRSWIFNSVGLTDQTYPVRPRILINDKGNGKADAADRDPNELGDRRRIVNARALQEHLAKTFPDAQVDCIRFTAMSWRNQLENLGNTSVFITTEGSSSFRYAFLPEGASTIVLSHPDNFTAGANHLAAHRPYHEIDKYFPISYVRFLEYDVDVTNEDEYVTRWEGSADDPNKRIYELYDAHVVVKMERIVPLVKSALLSFEAKKFMSWKQIPDFAEPEVKLLV